MVGIPSNMQPKAIGQCVWQVSKLSDGYNKVHVSKELKAAWPSTKGGTLKFTPLKSEKHTVAGFEVRASITRAWKHSVSCRKPSLRQTVVRSSEWFKGSWPGTHRVGLEIILPVNVVV